MTLLDWIVIAIYIAIIVGMASFLARRQKSSEDYFLGGHKMSYVSVGFSLLANQVSAISLIGAPAFVALKSEGGLKWLQYELAIPLAMIFLMHFLVPALRKYSITSIYEYLGKRFGKGSRLTVSTIFLLSRGLGTGVVLYASGVVMAAALSISLSATMILMGVISVLYTTIGGIQADIYSDIIQLVIIWIGTAASIVAAVSLLGPHWSFFSHIPADRLATVDFSHHGFGDGETFSFWPMLIGGFFLYVSYYGCDQSQSQRLLTTPTSDTARKALFINGLLRFPLVLGYCFLGLLMIGILQLQPQLQAEVPREHPDFLIPLFIIKFLPSGLTGLILAGLLAASMSSLDSAFNSLSAVTMRDFIQQSRLKKWNKRKQLLASRACTFGWGAFCTGAGFCFARSSDTVIEIVNKVGSIFYGPVLAAFLMGIFFRKLKGSVVITALMGSVFLNLSLWLFTPTISWMWWNVTGFLASFIIALIYTLWAELPQINFKKIFITEELDLSSMVSAKASRLYLILAIAFIVIFFLLVFFQFLPHD
jgi:SSS family transporter